MAGEPLRGDPFHQSIRQIGMKYQHILTSVF